MEDKCPKCGETLVTRTIKKKLGSGSIDYPIALICQKCKWSKDLTGAGDIPPKPVMQDAGETKKEAKTKEIIQEKIPEIKPPVIAGQSSKPVLKSKTGINTIIPIILSLLVVGAIAWVFFMNPAQEKPVETPPAATPAATVPVITQTQVPTPVTTVVPEATASGKQTSVRLETKRGFTPKTTTIKPGDEIVWTNDGIYAVTLISSEGLFEDKFLNNAKRTSYIFRKSGTFNFYLKEDKNLTGTIIAEP